MQPTLAAFLKRSAQATVAAQANTAGATVPLPVATSTTIESATVKAGDTVSVEVLPNADESISAKRVKVTNPDVSSVVVEVSSEQITHETVLAPKASGFTGPATWVDREIDRLGECRWRDILRKEAQKARPLFSFLDKLPESKILPPKDKVFEAFRLCPFEDVRVVILGQDPYHGPRQAHGLAFSVMDGVQVPPSLRNIFKEAAADVGAKSGKSGNLDCWAKQGVLLLNALLTVEAGTPMAHKNRGWEKFTDACIMALSKEKKNVVFLLWGKPAQEKGRMVDKSKHCIITSSHPSPLGASQTAEPFLGSRCFSRCNDYLKQHGEGEIKWDCIG